MLFTSSSFTQSYFFQLSFFILLASVSSSLSARTNDTTVASNLPLYLQGNWCLDKEVVKAFDENDTDDVSHKGEFWNFSESGNYTFDGRGKDPYEIIENKIKMTHFTTLKVLEISPEKMIAKAQSTYYFTKNHCSAETIEALKTSQLNIAIRLNDINAVKQFIKDGIDVSKRNTRSMVALTPLMVAVQNKNIPIIKLLLKQKPDLTVESAALKTALDYAKKTKSQEIKDLIQNAY